MDWDMVKYFGELFQVSWITTKNSAVHSVLKTLNKMCRPIRRTLEHYNSLNSLKISEALFCHFISFRHDGNCKICRSVGRNRFSGHHCIMGWSQFGYLLLPVWILLFLLDRLEFFIASRLETLDHRFLCFKIRLRKIINPILGHVYIRRDTWFNQWNLNVTKACWWGDHIICRKRELAWAFINLRSVRI